MMSVEDLGKKLLGEIEEVGLDEVGLFLLMEKVPTLDKV